MMKAIQNLSGEQGFIIIENGAWTADKGSEHARCAIALTDGTITSITQPDAHPDSVTRNGDGLFRGEFIWGTISAVEYTGKLQIFFASTNRS